VWSAFHRVAEEKIVAAQKAGAFDNLPGKGKPLELEDLSWVPEDLRVAYHILKNAHVLPPEAELLKEIHALEDLLPVVPSALDAIQTVQLGKAVRVGPNASR
jgi:hypothetical protein